MENATQALIIAAGVLIGVIILSMAVYLMATMGQYAADTQSKIDSNQIAQFNDKFLQYEGLTDLTIQDIITVKNYALENNKEVDGYNPSPSESKYRASDNNDFIDVYYNDKKVLVNSTSSLIMHISDQKLLEDEIDKQKDPDDPKEYNRFTCELKLNPSTGKVNKIYFYET